MYAHYLIADRNNIILFDVRFYSKNDANNDALLYVIYIAIIIVVIRLCIAIMNIIMHRYYNAHSSFIYIRSFRYLRVYSTAWITNL